MDRNLELMFKNAAGKNAKISVKDPKEDLSTEEVQTILDNIIEKNVFTTTGGDLVEIVGARLVQKEIIQLIG